VGGRTGSSKGHALLRSPASVPSLAAWASAPDCCHHLKTANAEQNEIRFTELITTVTMLYKNDYVSATFPLLANSGT